MKNKYLLALCLACAFILPSIHASHAAVAEVSAEPEHIAKLRTFWHSDQSDLLGDHMEQYGAERFTPEFVNGMFELTKDMTAKIRRVECFLGFLDYSKNKHFPAFKEKFSNLYKEFDVGNNSEIDSIIPNLVFSLAYTEPTHFDELVDAAREKETQNDSVLYSVLDHMYTITYDKWYSEKDH